MFGGGSKPKPQNIPVPTRTSTQVQEAAEQQRQALVSETSATNWLTGGLGVDEKKLKTGAASLLGG